MKKRFIILFLIMSLLCGYVIKNIQNNFENILSAIKNNMFLFAGLSVLIVLLIVSLLTLILKNVKIGKTKSKKNKDIEKEIEKNNTIKPIKITKINKEQKETNEKITPVINVEKQITIIEEE